MTASVNPVFEVSKHMKASRAICLHRSEGIFLALYLEFDRNRQVRLMETFKTLETNNIGNQCDSRAVEKKY